MMGCWLGEMLRADCSEIEGNLYPGTAKTSTNSETNAVANFLPLTRRRICRTTAARITILQVTHRINREGTTCHLPSTQLLAKNSGRHLAAPAINCYVVSIRTDSA